MSRIRIPQSRWLDHPARALALCLATLIVLVVLALLIPHPAGSVTERSLLGMRFAQGRTPTPALVIYERDPTATAEVKAATKVPPRIEPFGEPDDASVAHDLADEAYQVELVRSATLRGWLLPVYGTVDTHRVIMPLTGEREDHLADIPALYTDWLAQRPSEPLWSMRMPATTDHVQSWWVNPPAALVHAWVVAAPLVMLRSGVVWWRARRTRTRIAAHECVRCRYALHDLMPASGPASTTLLCPECGTSNPASPMHQPINNAADAKVELASAAE